MPKWHHHCSWNMPDGMVVVIALFIIVVVVILAELL
jgi:hypothetical protein